MEYSRSTPALWVLVLILVAGSPMSGTPSFAEHPACNPTEALRSELSELDPDLSGCRHGEPCRAQSLERIKSLIAEQGFNRHLLAIAVYLEGRDGIRDHSEIAHELIQIAESRENDPDAWALAGGSVRGAKGDQMLQKALDLDPEHPWAHLSMAVRWLREQPEQAAQSLSRFLELCPSRLRQTKSYPQRVGSGELWRRHLPALEKATASLPEAERLATLPALWRLQFSSLPADQHGAVREEISRQLTGIKAMQRQDREAWWHALEEGFERVGDAAALETLKSDRQALFPCRPESVSTRIEAIVKRYIPGAGAMKIKSLNIELTPDQLAGIAADMDALGSECNGNKTVLSWRFRLLEKQKDASSVRIRSIADAYLASQTEGGRARMSSPEYQVAKLFVDREVSIRLVPDLIQEARAHRTDWSQMRMPEPMRARMEAASQRIDVDIARIASEAFQILRKPKEARHEAELARKLYLELDPEVHGRALVELHRQVNTLLERQRLKPLFGPVPKSGENRESREKQAAKWRDVSEPMPEFSLTDLNGKIWTQAELAGQGVLINFWATWCSSCVAALSDIQVMHQTLADVEGLTVMTFNVDRNVSKVKLVMDQENFDFPVLQASGFLHPDESPIPLNWIVDREGAIRKKSSSFTVDGPLTWRQEAFEALKELASDRR